MSVGVQPEGITTHMLSMIILSGKCSIFLLVTDDDLVTGIVNLLVMRGTILGKVGRRMASLSCTMM